MRSGLLLCTCVSACICVSPCIYLRNYIQTLPNFHLFCEIYPKILNLVVSKMTEWMNEWKKINNSNWWQLIIAYIIAYVPLFQTENWKKTLYNLLSKNRHQCGHGGVAIRHVLPFLWTTPYLHITARNKSCENDVHSTWLTRWQHR